MNLGKCPRCGCTGIHACMGSHDKGLDFSDPDVYNRFKAAIEHIRKSEAESKNDKPSRSH